MIHYTCSLSSFSIFCAVLKRPSDGSDDEIPTKHMHVASIGDEGIIQVQENPALRKGPPHLNGSVPMYIMYTNPLTSSPQTATSVIQNRGSPITMISSKPPTSSNGPVPVMHIANPNGYSAISSVRPEVIQTPISRIYRSSPTVFAQERSSLTSSESSSSSENDSDSEMSTHSPVLSSPPPLLRKEMVTSPTVSSTKPMIIQNGPISIAKASSTSSSPALSVAAMEAIPQQSFIIQAAPSGLVNNLGQTKFLLPMMPQGKGSTMIQPNGQIIFSDQQQQQLPLMQTAVPIFQMGGQFSAVQPMQLVALTGPGPHVIQNNPLSS